MAKILVTGGLGLIGSTLNPVRHGLGVALTVVKLRFRSLLCRLIGGICCRA